MRDLYRLRFLDSTRSTMATSWIPLDPAVELARLNMIEGMNHVLKEVREASQQIASYSDPNLQLHPRLTVALIDFLKRVAEDRRS